MSLRIKQHRLLGVLHEPCITYSKTLKGIPALSFEQIFEKTGFDYKQLSIIAARLYSDKEIHPYDVGGIKGLCLISDGITAYSEKKYLKERRKSLMENAKNAVSIIIPVMSLCLSFAIFMTSEYKLEQQNKVLKALKLELQQLRSPVKS